MPRRRRINLPGLPQHIVQRGVNREPCFFAQEDYQCYLHWLMKAAADYRCAVHAYVLMTNHVHLLLSPEPPDGPARLMQSVGRRYVQYINRSYRRTGTLWEGRYKSSLVQEDRYVLICSRYIELNPVRAGMVADPGQYPWSSYQANGLGQSNELLTAHPQYLELGEDESGRQTACRALFRVGLDEDALSDIRLALAQGQPIGHERYREAICAATGVRRAQARRGGPAKQAGSARGLLGDQSGFGF